ncbi:phosphoribosylanthranilate isomerase [Prevotella cerevisiae]|uniref:N-(5'-phosphoribosyl)anthranilate isomerase n=1 Tax=Segatella cerevisiae TaxID=2053716 RepID=A0ABT1BXW4_9BACT|nr:phosphoribosylanthranilate isomerase [Segatella cerevisiae]MCO6025901.1 phosphoribosylanthranilate isomerase [Segatella cerevisiae]
MKIKVCGLRDVANIRAVSQLDIDLMGFIFFPKSPRYVLANPNFPKLSKGDTAGDGKPERVGVFVDEMPQKMIRAIYDYGLTAIQLHGQESRVLCENLRKTLDPDICPGIKLIKAISVKEPADVDRYKVYEGAVDYFLFDTKCNSAGGSGRHFDWSVLDGYDGDTPFLLSGGIGPEDAARVRSFHHPKFAGIDLNSRFEISPALKDIDKLQTFIEQVRS